MKSKTDYSFWQYFAFVNFIFGAKLWLIGKYGNQTPFEDQWDAEAFLLYKSFLDGTLKLSFLFSCHNEHHIFTTRLLALGELFLNGIWNPLLQMVVNAAIHAGTLSLLLALLSRVLGRNYLPALLLFSAFIFALPYAYENTLTGFQVQFYFVILFSFVSLWLTTLHEPFSLKWMGGLACALLAFFSFSSGAFAIAASILVGIIFYLFSLRKTGKQILGVLLLVGLFAACVALTPLDENQNGKAKTIIQFGNSLIDILSWPSPYKALSLFQNLPIILFCFFLLRKIPPVNDKKWFLISLIIWIGIVSFGIAYARSISPLSSRYMDLFVLTLLINFACSLALVDEYRNKRKGLAIAAVIFWTLYACASLQIYNASLNKLMLRGFYESRLEQEKNTKIYMKNGKIEDLKNKNIPYPDPNRLATILSNAEVRSILPSNIAPADRPMKQGRFDNLINDIIAKYYAFIILSLLSALTGGLLFFVQFKKSEKIPV